MWNMRERVMPSKGAYITKVISFAQRLTAMHMATTEQSAGAEQVTVTCIPTKNIDFGLAMFAVQFQSRQLPGKWRET